MALWTRIGPGQYKNTKTGKVISGQAKDPNGNPKFNGKNPTVPGPVTDPAAGPTPGQSAVGGNVTVSVQDPTITPENFAGQRKSLEDLAYTGLTSDFATRQAQQKQQLEQDLYNRGYRPDQTTTDGPGGWNAMTGELTNNWNDAYLQARVQASQLGGQEFDRMFGAQQDTIDSQISREANMISGASSAADRATQERIARQTARNNARIARMQLAARGGGARPTGEETPSRGFDII
jgi:hypothetical protein